MRNGSRARTSHGSAPGAERRRWGLGAFIDDEGGYTTVAVATALLASLSLVFAAASAQWVLSRTARAQEVADAAALAGANAVAAYSTVAQTLDAAQLSLGLTGMVVYGAGLVASCVPTLAPTGVELVSAGAKVLDARRDLSRSAAEGLRELEAALPALVIANSASCVAANSADGISYAGCAVPYPQQGLSDFSALDADVDDSSFSALAEDMRRAAADEADAKKAADEARERGWRADCGATPYCMWQRAQTLAGLGEDLNPFYPSAESWSFGAALERARAYYDARASRAAVEGPGGERLTDTACAKAFYEYARGRVWRGSYAEAPDGTVEADLPELPRNAEQTRGTELYTDARWPCTSEPSGTTLHSSLECPGAAGPYAGDASVADLEAGALKKCGECRMCVGELGRVAAASTSIGNGFEHWWSEAVEASKEYREARNRQVEARKRLKDKASEGADAFKGAVEALNAVRPSLCPPGAWGCVAVVARGEGASVPSELTAAFLSSASLPAGAAVSAAALAPDGATAENNVLASFFDGLSARESLLGGALDGVATLWGRLMVSYGSAYESLASAGGDFLDRLDGVLGGSVGSWLKGRLGEIMRATGLEPCDMRLKKPVLANTQKVLGKAGFDRAATVKSLLGSLPDSGDAGDYLKAFGAWALENCGDEDFTVAELTVPGTDVKIPLKVNLAKLAGAL